MGRNTLRRENHPDSVENSNPAARSREHECAAWQARWQKDKERARQAPRLYSAYQPENIEKVLDIFRVYYNYCLAGKDGKTPAMRVGLTAGVADIGEILGFRVTG